MPPHLLLPIITWLFLIASPMSVLSIDLVVWFRNNKLGESALKIAVAGDTHGKVERIKRELKLLKPDALFFTGDYYSDGEKLANDLKLTFYGVSGNCDYCRNGPQEKIVELEGYKFLIVHGHQYGVKKGLNRLFYRGLESQADMVVFGHTHVSCAEKVEGLWLLNPGSPTKPRLPDHASYAIIEINKPCLNPEIIRIQL